MATFEVASESVRAMSLPGLLGRALLGGLVYALAMMIGGAIVSALGLPLLEIPVEVDPAESLLTGFLSGALISVFLGPLAARLSIPGVQRFLVLFVTLFVLNSLINVIEALFFFRYPAIEYASALLISGGQHFALAALLAWLFPPRAARVGFAKAVGETLRQRRWFAWIWRFGLAGLLYLPTYWFFGLLALPYVLPFYQDPSLNLGFSSPGVEVLVPLELGRGLLFVLTLFGLVAVLPGGRLALALWLGFTIAVLGAWQPMLQASWFPVTMRVAHGLEITGTAFVQGVTIAVLLGSAPVEPSGA